MDGQPLIGVVDYGMGNLKSVGNACDFLGIPSRILKKPDELTACSHCIVPGVGAFKEAMVNLERGGWLDVLRLWALQDQRPILGICLGMQLFADQSEEFGLHEGLKWIPGEVKRIVPEDRSYRIPHMGWNDVQVVRDSVLYRDIPADSDFYFVHSYHFICLEDHHLTGTCMYGGRVTASIERDNIFAVQFHPEKSGPAGLQLLRNFSAIEA